MLGRLRSVLGVVFLAGCTWCSFVVPLGDKTFVEHLDAIGDTPEAEALRAGANQALVPTLEELQHRVLGEYVEAPTASDVTLASGAPARGEAPSGKRPNGKAREKGAAKDKAPVSRADAGKAREVAGRPSSRSAIPRAE